MFESVVYAAWSMVTSSTTSLFHRLLLLHELHLGLVFIPNGTWYHTLCLRLGTYPSNSLLASFTAVQTYATLLIGCTGLGAIFGSVAIGILMDRSFKQAEAEYRAQHDLSPFFLENHIPQVSQ